jgi:hypothetical protein
MTRKAVAVCLVARRARIEDVQPQSAESSTLLAALCISTMSNVTSPGLVVPISITGQAPDAGQATSSFHNSSIDRSAAK